MDRVIRRTTLVGNVFKESDIDAAWFWDEDEDFLPSPNILPALQDLGIPHDEEDVEFVEINQNIAIRIGNQEYVSGLAIASSCTDG